MKRQLESITQEKETAQSKAAEEMHSLSVASAKCLHELNVLIKPRLASAESALRQPAHNLLDQSGGILEHGS